MNHQQQKFQKSFQKKQLQVPCPPHTPRPIHVRTPPRNVRSTNKTLDHKVDQKSSLDDTSIIEMNDIQIFQSNDNASVDGHQNMQLTATTVDAECSDLTNESESSPESNDMISTKIKDTSLQPSCSSLEPAESIIPSSVVQNTPEVTDKSNRCRAIMITNLATEVTVEGLTDLFSLEKTEYLKLVCSCKIGQDYGEDDSPMKRKIAIIMAPSHIVEEILKLDSIELHNEEIKMEELSLEFYQVEVQALNTQSLSERHYHEDSLLDFIMDNEMNKILSRCVVLEVRTDAERKNTYISAILATTVKSYNKYQELAKKIDEDNFFHLLQGTMPMDIVNALDCDSEGKRDGNEQTIERKKILENTSQAIVEYPLNSLIDVNSVAQITQEIRNYSMNICKQMKNKLLFIDRKAFSIRRDKGSSSREQLYIECGTACYEYLRFYLINILKSKLKCEEDLNKRREAKDLNEKSEVEAQHSIQFYHGDVKYNVHITFYYTKCSLWIQGPPGKINNITVAQFFTIQYLERVANMVERTIPLDEIGHELKLRITSFLSNEENGTIQPRNKHISETKCVTCNRKCSDNKKSIVCCQCGMKQHFHCASIKDESERRLYLDGGVPFTCNMCFAEGSVYLDDVSGESPPINIAEPPSEHPHVPVLESRLDKPSSGDQLETGGHSVPSTINCVEQNNCVAGSPSINVDKMGVESSTSPDLLPSNHHNNTTLIDTPDTTNEQDKELLANLATATSNHEKILIRRLQNEINRLSLVHTEIQEKLMNENSQLKESLRQCIVDCEKEREMKETLQHCVKALKVKEVQTTSHSPLSNDNRPSNGRGQKICRFFNMPNGCNKGVHCTFSHEQQTSSIHETGTLSTIKKKCRFFNKVGGCREGIRCKFMHVPRPLCKWNPSCSNPRCSFNHNRVNFPQASPPTKPPDFPTQRKILSQPIQEDHRS